MQTSKWTYLLVASGAAAGALFLSTAASAAQQNYPGALCVSTSTSLRMNVTSLGEASNGSTSTQSVICPIVRDLASFSTGSASSRIWLLDRHLNSNITCSSRARDPSNGSLLTTASQSSVGAGVVQSLIFTGPTVTGSFPYRFILCSVPGTYSGSASLIRSYRSAEL